MPAGLILVEGLQGRRGDGSPSGDVLDMALPCDPSAAAFGDDLCSCVNYVPSLSLGSLFLAGTLTLPALEAFVSCIDNVIQDEGCRATVCVNTGFTAAALSPVTPSDGAVMTRAHDGPASVRCRPFIGFAAEQLQRTPVEVTLESSHPLDGCVDVVAAVQECVNSMQCYTIERVAGVVAARAASWLNDDAVAWLRVTVRKPSIGRLTKTELECGAICLLVHTARDAAFLEAMRGVPLDSSELMCLTESVSEYLQRKRHEARVTCPPPRVEVTCHEAAETHRAFLHSAQDEYASMRHALESLPAWAAMLGRQLHILDVGAGAGALVPFLDESLAVASYDAVEPNTHLHADLREALTSTGFGHVATAHAGAFGEAWEAPSSAPYDLILFSHSLYDMPHAAACVQRALRQDVLAPGGKVIVVNQLTNRFAAMMEEVLRCAPEARCADSVTFASRVPLRGDNSDNDALRFLTGRRIETESDRTWALQTATPNANRTLSHLNVKHTAVVLECDRRVDVTSSAPRDVTVNVTQQHEQPIPSPVRVRNC